MRWCAVILPLLSFRSLGRFLDRHAAFGPAQRYQGEADRPAMLHCGGHSAGLFMAPGHLVPLPSLFRKGAPVVAKVMARYAAKFGKPGKNATVGHVMAPLRDVAANLDGENCVGTYVN
jgi:hypothetical protein